MNLWDHLGELRRRLIICLVVLAVGAGVGAWTVNPILDWIARPLGVLVFIAPMEAFSAQIKITLWVSFFLSLPVLLFQIWAFVSMGLTSSEKRSLRLVMPFFYLLFVGGFALSSFVVFPRAIEFLLTLRSKHLEPMLSVGPYLDMFFLSGLILGALFQMPLVLLCLARIGLIQPKTLTQNRKFTYVAIFLLAAIFNTGPDMFTQILLAIPAVLLFEVSVLLIQLESRKSRAH